MNYQYKHCIVTARLLDERYGFDDYDMNPMNHYRFMVTVKNINTHKRHGFIFTDSAADYNAGKIHMTREDLKEALLAFLEDAECGSRDYEEFCSDMGYDTDSRHAHAIWTACKKATPKIAALGLCLDDINTLNGC